MTRLTDYQEDRERVRTSFRFRRQLAAEQARERHGPGDHNLATVARLQVQLEDDAERGDPAARELRSWLLTWAIEELMENPRWL